MCCGRAHKSFANATTPLMQFACHFALDNFQTGDPLFKQEKGSNVLLPLLIMLLNFILYQIDILRNHLFLRHNRNMASFKKEEDKLKAEASRKLYHSTDPVERLRLRCLQRGVNGIKGIARIFRNMDDNLDRKLNREELEKGCTEFGLEMESSELDDVFQQLDRNDNGSIEFDEFLVSLRPPMSKSRLDLIDAAFHKMDKTGDGVITVDDLKGVYNVRMNPKFINGELTEDQLFHEFLNSFDSDNKDGKVTKEEFLNYYAGVSASVDTDAYFDLMMRKCWKL